MQTLPTESSYRLAVERVRANAERIRRVELPSYEQLVNVRAKRYRLLADVYDRLRRRADVAPRADDEYCAWRRAIDADPGSCDCRSGGERQETAASGGDDRRRNVSSSSMPPFDGCDLPPVEPLIHHRSFVVVVVTNIRWRGGATGKAFGLAISRWRVQILLEATLRNNLRQVVYTYVPLSPSSITWCRPNGGDALRLGR